MTPPTTLLCGATLLATLGTASAQERPRNIYPTHDVAITYTVTDARRNSTSTVEMHWRDGGQEARVDLPGSTYAIVNRGADQAMLVMPRQRVVMEIPLSATPVSEFLPDGGSSSGSTEFTRGGSDTVLGRRCTIWTLRNARGTASVCLTDDGVVLRAEGHANDGEGGAVLASAVHYGPQPQSLFTPPPDLPKLDLPPSVGKLLMAPQEKAPG